MTQLFDMCKNCGQTYGLHAGESCPNAPTYHDDMTFEPVREEKSLAGQSTHLHPHGMCANCGYNRDSHTDRERELECPRGSTTFHEVPEVERLRAKCKDLERKLHTILQKEAQELFETQTPEMQKALKEFIEEGKS